MHGLFITKSSEYQTYYLVQHCVKYAANLSYEFEA